MAILSKVGDWTFKAFTAGLVVTTVYFAGYRALSWHRNSQSKMEKEKARERKC